VDRVRLRSLGLNEGRTAERGCPYAAVILAHPKVVPSRLAVTQIVFFSLVCACRLRSHRTKPEILGKFVLEFGLGRNLFLSSGIDLSACAAGATQEPSDGSAFTAAKDGAQNRAHSSASANVLGGALICA
jgi:hypothetical protein